MLSSRFTNFLNISKSRKFSGFLLSQRNYSSATAATTTTATAAAASTDFDAFNEVLAESFTYSPANGYIRNSPLEPILIPNLRLDQYIWKDYRQWENHTAMVNISYYRFVKEVRSRPFFSFCHI